jgi:glutathione S-transferase
LFPAKWRGVQSVLWRFIENEIEGATFRLNDIYFKENVPPAEQLQFLRFKERKFGRGCIDQWRKDQKTWLKRLEELLIPFEIILTHQMFLLDDQPHFVDFDLFGMLENFLYSGHYKLPTPQTNPTMASPNDDNQKAKMKPACHPNVAVPQPDFVLL